MIHPVDDPIGQEFGANPTRNNPDPVFGNYQPDGHSGRDYKCWAGTPVRAVTSGTVLHIGRMPGTYADNPWWIQPAFAGYVAVIDHGSFIGIYGHCMDGSAKVRKGDRVAEGQVFVLSGNTGASTGDHLHFEILPDGYVLNSRMYGRINPASLFGGIQFQSGTTTTPIQEDDMPTPADLWNHPLDLDGQQFTAGDILVYARKNAADAKTQAEAAKFNAETAAIAAQQAPGLAVQTLLATKLPTPDGSAEYTIADYITYGWWYAMQAKDKPTGAVMDPAAIAAAVQVSAAEVVKRLEITVKES